MIKPMVLLGLIGMIAPAMGEQPPGFLRTKEGRFVDAEGRQVILHGINVGNKQAPYVTKHQPADYATLHSWGFNSIRLLILWAAIEPECGQYNDEYLKALDERIAWAKENGLYVLLDMHQDLWGERVRGGDGAPAWATLDDGRPEGPPVAVWSDAYYTNGKVQAAFDNFWANKPGPDGVGLQDRFAQAWRHVAERYAHEPAIIAYEFLNEPFIGTGALLAPLRAVPKLIEVLFAKNPGTTPLGLTDVIAMATSVEGRIKLMQIVDDIEVYRALINAVEPAFQTFEKEKLAPMYARVAKAIREVDRNHILFYEPSVSSNIGIRSALPALMQADVKPDPLQAYAPHAYDIVTDTPAAAEASDTRLNLIFQRHAEHAQRLGLPMVINEWGAFYNSTQALPAARMCVGHLEQTLAGDMYWDLYNGIEKAAYFEALTRPYPAAISGILLEYHTEPAARLLECRWKEDPAIHAPSIIYLPPAWYPNGANLTISPSIEAPSGNPGFATIPPADQPTERRLTARPKP